MPKLLSVRNEHPLAAGRSGQSLVLNIEVPASPKVFLLIPRGDGAGSLMTEAEFQKVADNSGFSFCLEGKDQATTLEPNKEKFIPLPSQNAGLARLTIGNFTTNKAGKVVLRLTDQKRADIDTVEVTVEDAKPRIVSFKSSHYIVNAGAEFQLSWTIEPKTAGHKLSRENVEIDSNSGVTHKSVKAPPNVFTLEALPDGDKRRLRVHTVNETAINSFKGPGDHTKLGLKRAEILGVYDRSGAFYAVVRDQDAKNRASIWLLKDWLGTADPWEPLTFTPPVGDPRPATIPVEAASRPGVIFDDKLYFLGGSSFDINERGKEVGFFSFTEKAWVPVTKYNAGGHVKPWPIKMRPRMGHSVLASPDGGRLWVIGGHDGRQALSDVWVYDKAKGEWAPHPAPVTWKGRCLAGATILGDQLWLAGGHDTPGGKLAYHDIWHLGTGTGGKWEMIKKLDLRPDGVKRDELQYRGCALASLDRKIYAFSAYLSGSTPHNQVRRVELSGSIYEWSAPLTGNSDWVAGREVDPDAWYRLDATAFGNVMFIRRLARASRKDESLHYLVCY